MKTYLLIPVMLLTIFALTFISCSGSKDTSNTDLQASKADSVYVFDQVPAGNFAKDSLSQQPAVVPPKMNVTYYLVQIGAFTTNEKAQTFMDMAKKLLKYNMEISFNDSLKLYVVQITPPYSSRAEAEKVRNELWQMDRFKDAWILTINK